MNESEAKAAEAAWFPIINALGTLVADAWRRSKDQTGLSTDPRMVSVQLFMRLMNHRNAFAALLNERLYVDAEIICRSAIETAVSLVNLNVRRAAFVADLRSDAANTIQEQLPIWFKSDPEFLAVAQDDFHTVFGAKREDGEKHTRLRLGTLAYQADLASLYRYYKVLSGLAAHVTGLSVALDAIPIEDEQAEELALSSRRFRRVNAMAVLSGAVQAGTRAHANTMGFQDIEKRAFGLMDELSRASSLLVPIRS